MAVAFFLCLFSLLYVHLNRNLFFLKYFDKKYFFIEDF